MNILVTGGAGFLGSNLCEKLLNDGYKVFCLDNLFTGLISNIAHLFDNPDFVFVEGDIVNGIKVFEKIDQLYNLACPASPIAYQSNPILTLKTCTVGVLNVLDFASKHSATVLQASTSEVYGDPLVHPQTEDYFGNVNPCGRRSCYDEGKRCAEAMFFDYFRTFNIPIKVVRIFNTYGEKMAINDGRVVSNFIVQALKGSDITIYGNGNQTRSFCYVSDLIDGLTKMMNSPFPITGPINLGNPEEFTVLDLAEMILKLTGSNSKIIYKAPVSDDPQKRKPNIEKANTVLSWTPHVSIEEGLKKTIRYFEQVPVL